MSDVVPNPMGLRSMKAPPSKEIDGFLSRVTDVEAQLKGLMDGSLKPEEVVIPGEDAPVGKKKTPEQLAEEEREAEVARQTRERLRKERRAREMVEERRKWWDKAEFHFSHVAGDSDEEDEEGEGARAGRGAGTRDGKDAYQRGLDYKKWQSWTPKEDPASREEEAKKEEEEQAKKNAEFEQLNSEWCSEVKNDMKERKKKKVNKLAESARAKGRGNDLFKKGEYLRALSHYHDALELTPYEIPVLTNMAMAHIKLGELDEAEDFCKRALRCNPRCVKALFRRSVVARARTPIQWEAAIADLEAAVKLEPRNEDLAKELARTKADAEEAAFEATVLADAAAAKAKAAGGSAPAAAQNTTTAAAAAAPAPAAASATPADAVAAPAPAAPAAASAAAAPELPAAASGASNATEAAAAPADAAAAAAVSAPAPAPEPVDDSPFGRIDRLRARLAAGSRVSATVLADELAAIGRIADVPANATYLRSSKALRALCEALKAARDRAAAEAPAANDVEVSVEEAMDTARVQERAMLVLGNACGVHNAKASHNGAVLISAGGLDAILDAACDERAGFESAVAAARMAIEVVAAGEKARAVVHRSKRLLAACQASLEQCATAFAPDRAESPPPSSLMDLAAKSASLVQIVALQQKNKAMVAALAGSVPPLLRCVAGCTAHLLLHSPLLQSCCGALANLAHHEPLRPVFAQKLEGMGDMLGVRALLALLVIPVPYTDALLTARGSALAALSNAGMDCAPVRQALCDSHAVEGLLDSLEGKMAAAEARIAEATRAAEAAKSSSRGKGKKKADAAAQAAAAATLAASGGAGGGAGAGDGAGAVQRPPAVIAERAASLLARLTQQPDGAAKMREDATLRRLCRLIVDAPSFGDARAKVEDCVVRCLASAVVTPDHVKALFEEGALLRLGVVLSSGLSDVEGRGLALGNLSKVLITVAADPSAGHFPLLLKARVPDNLIELVKRSKPGPVRKNCAVALARLARDPECMTRIRDLRGMEILMTLSKELTS